MPRGAGSAGRQRPRELPLGGRAVRRGDEASLAAPQRGAGGRFGELTGPAATAPPDIAAAGQRVAIARPRGTRYDGRRPGLGARHDRDDRHRARNRARYAARTPSTGTPAEPRSRTAKGSET